MNRIIEDNLILNLTRIFTHYGWRGQGTPDTWQDKLDYIRYGLWHGLAYDFATHLKMIIQARRKDKKWGMFTPEFVVGTSLLLDDYADNNDLFTITPTKIEFTCVSSNVDNVFKNSPVIKRLKMYDITVINFKLIEEFGEKKVLSDLKQFFPKATLTVNYDTHEPDQIRDWVYDNGSRRMTIYIPLMPIAVVSTGKKR